MIMAMNKIAIISLIRYKNPMPKSIRTVLKIIPVEMSIVRSGNIIFNFENRILIQFRMIECFNVLKLIH